MTREERLALGRERVKRWKKNHPKSIKGQWARRYQRKKAEETTQRRGVLVKIRVIEPEDRGSQETFYEHLALVDGDRETVWANAREYSRRSGRAIPEGLREPQKGEGAYQAPGDGPLMEPKQKGGQVERVSVEQLRVVEDLARIVARRKKPGVQVPELQL